MRMRPHLVDREYLQKTRTIRSKSLPVNRAICRP
jgi:hypothetical protein